jgi:hypothetical protein
LTWRASLLAMVEELKRHHRVEIRVFHLFPPAASLEGVPEGLRALYAETDGVQLAWVDRADPEFDPAEPRWEDAPAPWDLPGSAPAARWAGVIWLPPAASLAEGRLDSWGAGILLEGDTATLGDGTAAPAADVVRHLMAWWGSVRHRVGPIAASTAHVPLDRVFAEAPENPVDVSLVVHVAEVRRVDAEDAMWAWVDRGLDPRQIAAIWADEGGASPTEVVELELEIDELPPSLFPAACAPALVGQLLGPWGYPERFTAAVDLSERPRWVVAFGAPALSALDDATAEDTEDTEITLAPVPMSRPSAFPDSAPDRPGFQFSVSVRHPGVALWPRVFPSPISLVKGRSWRPYPLSVIHELAASPDGALVAAIAESGDLRLWAVDDGSEVPLESQREPESFSELGFGRDGRLAVWDGNLVTRWEPDGSAAGFVHQPMASLEGFEASDRQFALWTERPVFLDLRGDHHGTIDCIDEDPVSRSALSPQGAHMAVGTEGGKICLYRLDDASRLWLVPTDLGEIRALAVAPWGTAIAAGGREAVVVFDKDGHELRRLPAHEGTVSALVWLVAGRFLASAGEDRMLRVWCARSGALLLEQTFPARIKSLVASAGWMAVATADRVELLTVSAATSA